MQGEARPKPVVLQQVPTSDVLKVPGPQNQADYSNISDMSCLLCSRQFKSIEQLQRHTQESALHKKNLGDKNLRELAHHKALARRNHIETTSHVPKYRDRASERRVLFNQPDLPLSDTQSIKEKQRCTEKLPSPPPAPTPPANPAEDEANVGGKLLKLMGWKTGTGLGAAGEGRVNPIDTVVYAPGAGLGAGKPKDLDRYNDSYLSMTQDSARNRYQET
jgi:RNA-binding protein 5/10